jgi:hypothetical protein
MTDNKEIPKEVRDAIKREAAHRHGTAAKYLFFIEGAEYSYLLSQQALEEKDKCIRELEEREQLLWKSFGNFCKELNKMQNHDQ